MTYQIVMRASDTPQGWSVYQLEDGTWNWRSKNCESGIGFATEKEAIKDAWENLQIGTQERERRHECKRRRALYEAAMAAGISIPEGWRFDGVEYSRRRYTGQPTNEFFVGPYEGKGFVPIGGNRVCVIDQATALAYDSVKEAENPKGYWIIPSFRRPSMVIWKTVNFESSRCFDTVPAAREDAWRHSRLSKKKGRRHASPQVSRHLDHPPDRGNVQALREWRLHRPNLPASRRPRLVHVCRRSRGRG